MLLFLFQFYSNFPFQRKSGILKIFCLLNHVVKRKMRIPNRSGVTQLDFTELEMVSTWTTWQIQTVRSRRMHIGWFLCSSNENERFAWANFHVCVRVCVCACGRGSHEEWRYCHILLLWTCWALFWFRFSSKKKKTTTKCKTRISSFISLLFWLLLSFFITFFMKLIKTVIAPSHQMKNDSKMVEMSTTTMLALNSLYSSLRVFFFFFFVDLIRCNVC